MFFAGEGCAVILGSLTSEKKKSLKQRMLSAYRETGKCLKEKVPSNSKNLAFIEPKMCGNSNAACSLNELFDSIPLKSAVKPLRTSFLFLY